MPTISALGLKFLREDTIVAIGVPRERRADYLLASRPNPLPAHRRIQWRSGSAWMLDLLHPREMRGGNGFFATGGSRESLRRPSWSSKMTKQSQKITLCLPANSFKQARAQQSNVRRVKAGVSIEQLAESIAQRTLLQSLSVRAIVDPR